MGTKRKKKEKEKEREKEKEKKRESLVLKGTSRVLYQHPPTTGAILETFKYTEKKPAKAPLVGTGYC